MTLTPAPARPPSSGLRSRRSTMANAASPRYASVLPPPVGKKRRSTNSRSGFAGSARPDRFSKRKASWKARHRGGSVTPSRASRRESAATTARFATRKASSASASCDSTPMPRSMRLAAERAWNTSSSAVVRRSPDRSDNAASCSSIQARYPVTSGVNASSAAAPSERSPSAVMESSTPDTSTVSVFSTSAEGTQVVRSRRHAPSVSSQSAATPWPAA